MKRFILALLLLMFATAASAYDTETCKYVSEKVWERFGYSVRVICVSDRIDLKIYNAPPVRDVKDLGRFFGYIMGWGTSLHKETNVDLDTRIVIDLGGKSMETTVGKCYEANRTGEYRPLVNELVESWR